MGNKLGWIIAGVLVLVLGGVILKIAVFKSHSAPTSATTRRGVLKLKTLGVSIALIVGSEPSAGGNAAEDYKKAIAVYKQNKRLIEDVIDNAPKMTGGYVPSQPAISALKQIAAHIAAGAKKADMDYFFTLTPKHLKVAYAKHEPIIGLEDIAASTNALTTYYNANKHYDKMLDTLKHQIVMGWHITKERKMLRMCTLGLMIQQENLNSLIDVYNDRNNTALRESAQEYLAAVETLLTAYQTKRNIIWSQDPEPGDTFNIIENDEDRCCRVQAILNLGRLRFLCTKEVDLEYIDELIKKYSNSEDPLEAAAAKAAAKMTKDDMKKRGYRFQ